MKLLFLALPFLSAASAFAAGSFRAESPVPAQLRGQILDALESQCGLGAEWVEQNTSVGEAAGETYYETSFSREGNRKLATVISGVGRLGGFGVINLDCGA